MPVFIPLSRILLTRTHFLPHLIKDYSKLRIDSLPMRKCIVVLTLNQKIAIQISIHRKKKRAPRMFSSAISLLTRAIRNRYTREPLQGYLSAWMEGVFGKRRYLVVYLMKKSGIFL